MCHRLEVKCSASIHKHSMYHLFRCFICITEIIFVRQGSWDQSAVNVPSLSTKTCASYVRSMLWSPSATAFCVQLNESNNCRIIMTKWPVWNVVPSSQKPPSHKPQAVKVGRRGRCQRCSGVLRTARLPVNVGQGSAETAAGDVWWVHPDRELDHWVLALPDAEVVCLDITKLRTTCRYVVKTSADSLFIEMITT